MVAWEADGVLVLGADCTLHRYILNLDHVCVDVCVRTCAYGPMVLYSCVMQDFHLVCMTGQTNKLLPMFGRCSYSSWCVHCGTNALDFRSGHFNQMLATTLARLQTLKANTEHYVEEITNQRSIQLCKL